MPTEVLHQQLAARDDRTIVTNCGLSILEDLLGLRVEEAYAIEVAHAGTSRHGDFDLLNCRIARDGDGGRELLDHAFTAAIREIEAQLARHWIRAG